MKHQEMLYLQMVIFEKLMKYVCLNKFDMYTWVCLLPYEHTWYACFTKSPSHMGFNHKYIFYSFTQNKYM